MEGERVEIRQTKSKFNPEKKTTKGRCVRQIRDTLFRGRFSHLGTNIEIYHCWDIIGDREKDGQKETDVGTNYEVVFSMMEPEEYDTEYTFENENIDGDDDEDEDDPN